MSTEVTRETITAYLDTLLKRGPFGKYFSDDVTFTLMGAGQEVKGRVEVEQFIRYFHEQAFDARPQLKNTIITDGKAALEADFIGTHTGDFLGVAATGRPVRVPYAVVYDLRGDKITTLRVYMPLDTLMQQLGATVAAQAVA